MYNTKAREANVNKAVCQTRAIRIRLVVEARGFVGYFL